MPPETSHREEETMACFETTGRGPHAGMWKFARWSLGPVLGSMMSISASGNECGRLCDLEWMETATAADVELEIGRGANPLTQEEGGYTPLHFAALANRDPEVSALLIQQGADPDSHTSDDGATSLHLAAGGAGIGNVYLFQMNPEMRTLEQKKAFEKNHPITTGNGPDIVELLLNSGADIEARDRRGATPLHRAASSNPNLEVTALLLDRGAELEARDDLGMTPLHMAAVGNTNPAVAGLLLARGADMETPSDVGKAVHLAATSFNPEILALLVKRGADIEVERDDKMTPLHLAAMMNPIPEAAKFLLDHGADPEARNNRGETPLHSAMDNYNPEVGILLIERGADVYAKDDEGVTPREKLTSFPLAREYFREWSEESYEVLLRLLP